MQVPRRHGVSRGRRTGTVGASRGFAVTSCVLLASLVVLPSAAATVVPEWLTTAVLGAVVVGGCTCVLARDAGRRPERVSWTVPVGVAAVLFLVGTIGASYQVAGSGDPFAGAAPLGYLGAPVMLLAALLLALRRELGGMRLMIALDGLCGMLAGLSAVTGLMAPLAERAAREQAATGPTLTAAPLVGAVLVAATLGAVGMVGRTKGRWFLLSAAGMVVFGLGNVVVTYGAVLGSHEPGSWLDAMWPSGLVLATIGATRLPARPVRSLPGASSLVVVSLAASVAVATLALAPPWTQAPLPTATALPALLVCGVRLALSFVQLRELASVREMALTDELTGIANRRALYAALDELFTAPGRPASFALALVDLDHFKAVNDSYGHATGDELLQAVVGRFSVALTDLGTRHLLARLGGDEFAIVLHEADSHNAAMACGSALQQSLVEPIGLRDVTLHARCSIGIASAPEHGGNRADLLFASDAAMYAAKTSGEAVCYHQPEVVGDRRHRLFVAEDLYGALERGELTVDYQPVLTVDGELRGAEALVRWNHPRRGRLAPDEFLEAAERYKLTSAIAERVLDLTLGDLARWRSGGADLTASINVSATDLRNEDLVQLVASALLTHGVPPEKVTIEITEASMMIDAERARAVMEALSGLGVRLSVDDYGTGYSSLEYLLRLPIDEIKLDRVFCSHLVTDERAAAIVRSTLQLTHALGLRMVAEGVEDAGTLFVLRGLGCDLVQGWHVGRPMPGDAFEVLVAQQLQRDRDLVARSEAQPMPGLPGPGAVHP